jgi:hypothetical protein
MKYFKRIIIFGIILIISCIFVGCGGNNQKSFNNLSSSERDGFLQGMMEETVKSNLKSPNSAKFETISDSDIKDDGNNEYEISSYVDADNSFGANIRNNFTVTIKVNNDYDSSHDGYGYTSENCNINEN